MCSTYSAIFRCDWSNRKVTKPYVAKGIEFRQIHVLPVIHVVSEVLYVSAPVELHPVNFSGNCAQSTTRETEQCLHKEEAGVKYSKFNVCYWENLPICSQCLWVCCTISTQPSIAWPMRMPVQLHTLVLITKSFYTTFSEHCLLMPYHPTKTLQYTWKANLTTRSIQCLRRRQHANHTC